MEEMKHHHICGVGNIAEPLLPVATPITSNEFWRWGSDNRFPAALAAMSRRSTTHRRIINDKADYITGKGFVCDTAQPLLCRLVARANGLGESLRQVIAKAVPDITELCLADGVVPDGCAVVEHEEPAHWLGTSLRVDKQKVAQALGPQLPQAVAGFLAEG